MSKSPAADYPRTGSLLVIFLTVFIDLLGFGLVLPLLPLYAKQFSTDGSGVQIGLLMASFSIMQFFFAPLWGRVSDRIGRRPVLMIGLSGSVIFYGLFGIAAMVAQQPDQAWLGLVLLYVSRIGAGIAGATISTAQAYIADTTTLEKRPKGMALIGMAFGLGFTFGPLLGLLALPDGEGSPGPGPGLVASALSAVALAMAVFMLPESKRPDSEKAGKKILDQRGFGIALRTPSIAMILLALFVCVFSFANFETTLSLLIKGYEGAAQNPFQFSFKGVCLTYAYIGLTLAFVQGGVVRRLAGKMDEGMLAATGALIEVAGFATLLAAIQMESWQMLYVALAIVVTGFSFMQPMLNSLLSRRSDPENQGAILGVGQSVSSMARIVGSGIGVPLLMASIRLPYYTAIALMALGFVFVVIAARGGKDYQKEGVTTE